MAIDQGTSRETAADELAVLRTALDNWPLPMSSDVNPAVDEAARRHESWLEAHGLANLGNSEDPLVVLQAPRVAALAYPRADLPVLALAADWTAWFFHFDDYFDEGPIGASEQRARRTVDFIRVVVDPGEGGTVPRGDRPLRRTRDAFADLMARTTAVMTDWQSQKFVSHLESYFEALVAEAVNREHGSIPDVKAYQALRRDTGPALPLLDLVEHAEGIRLPQAFHESLLFGHLMDAAADVAGWINDVFSAGKEQDRGDFHNLVLVLQYVNVINLAHATRLAIDKISERLEVLDNAATSIDEWWLEFGVSQAERVAIHRWAVGLRDFQHHADWYVHHARYAVS